MHNQYIFLGEARAIMQHCRLFAQVVHACSSLYQWGNPIDGSISSSLESIPIRGKTRDETGQMHPWMNVLIHEWAKYPWMINFHRWGATVFLDSTVFGEYLSEAQTHSALDQQVLMNSKLISTVQFVNCSALIFSWTDEE